MPSDAPAVSVVVPAYNRAREIVDSLGSILGQSFRGFELIVVDDASTDRTVEVVEAMVDPRVRLVRHEANRGPGAARNSGVAAARGRYVAFLDSDDRWYRDKLARQIAFLESSGARACCTAFHIRRKGREQPELRLPSGNVLRFADLIEQADVCIGTTMMIDRAFFVEIGPFDERLRRLEDWEWELRLAMHADLPFVAEPLACHNAPVSRPIADETRQAAEIVLGLHRERLAAQDPALARRLEAVTLRHVAYAAMKSGDRRGAVRYGLRSLRADPAHGFADLFRRLTR